MTQHHCLAEGFINLFYASNNKDTFELAKNCFYNMK